jgi:hypothetical protein
MISTRTCALPFLLAAVFLVNVWHMKEIPYYSDDIAGVCEAARFFANPSGEIHSFIILNVIYRMSMLHYCAAAPRLPHVIIYTVHFMNCCLAGLLLRRAFRVGLVAAYVASALILCNPFSFTVVGWISAGAYLWCVLFFLLACHAVVRYAETGRAMPLAASVVSQTASLLFFEAGVLVIPFQLFLFAFVRGRCGGGRSWGWRALAGLAALYFAPVILCRCVITWFLAVGMAQTRYPITRDPRVVAASLLGMAKWLVVPYYTGYASALGLPLLVCLVVILALMLLRNALGERQPGQRGDGARLCAGALALGAMTILSLLPYAVLGWVEPRFLYIPGVFLTMLICLGADTAFAALRAGRAVAILRPAVLLLVAVLLCNTYFYLWFFRTLPQTGNVRRYVLNFMRDVKRAERFPSHSLGIMVFLPPRYDLPWGLSWFGYYLYNKWTMNACVSDIFMPRIREQVMLRAAIRYEGGVADVTPEWLTREEVRGMRHVYAFTYDGDKIRRAELRLLRWPDGVSLEIRDGQVVGRIEEG